MVEENLLDFPKEVKLVTEVVPLNGNILISQILDVKAKIGSIYIPENARERPAEGIVLAIGKKRYTDYGIDIPHYVEVGDRVLFGKYAGAVILIDDQEFMIMRESEILAKLPKKPEVVSEGDN